MKKIISIVLIFLIVIALVLTPLFIKVRVDCKTQYGECPNQILEKISPLTGKNLWLAKKGIKKYLKSEFLVSDYSIQYKIPNILHVEILIKKAFAALRDNRSGNIVLVDGTGKVLSTSQDSALPTVLLGSNLPEVGTNVDTSTLLALKLVEGIYQMYQVNESLIDNSTLLVELPGQIKVIFPLEGESEILLGALRLIYSKVREDGNLAGYSQIDLRYKNPVLR